jgi:hypothetical protein
VFANPPDRTLKGFKKGPILLVMSSRPMKRISDAGSQADSGLNKGGTITSFIVRNEEPPVRVVSDNLEPLGIRSIKREGRMIHKQRECPGFRGGKAWIGLKFGRKSLKS